MREFLLTVVSFVIVLPLAYFVGMYFDMREMEKLLNDRERPTKGATDGE